MSIASEIANYGSGLSDAYDAVSDMSGVIPQDKNMNNLDTAIRTIPIGTTPNDGVLTITQNGTTVQTFSANQSSNVTAALTDTTYSDFVGTDGQAAGTAGLVPAPATTDAGEYLKADGTWDTPPGASYSAGTGIDITGTTIAVDTSTIAEVSDIPTKTSELTNNGSDNTSTYVEADELATVATSGSYADLLNKPTIPAAQVNSDWNADSGVAQILNKPTIPTVNDATLTIQQNGVEAGTFTANASSNATISLTDTTYSAMTGATSSAAGTSGLTPAPAAGDQGKVLHGDGTWKDATAKLVEMSYGESSAWAKFIAAYNAGSIVYCRASSNANPGSGSQTRKAFMAYVNNATSPTSVEFQYVRSNSSKSDSNQCDQVFVYTLTNANGGTWSAASRDMAPKILVDSTLSKTFSGGANASVTLGAKAMTGATSGTAGTAGIVPAPAAGDQNKVLKGDGTWGASPDGPLVAYMDGGTDSTFHTYSDSGLTQSLSGADIIAALKNGRPVSFYEDDTLVVRVYRVLFSEDSVGGSVIIDNGYAEYQAICMSGNTWEPNLIYNKNYLKNSLEYSTTESPIGKWINNKIIYRKAIQVTTGPSSNNSILVPVSGVDTMLKVYGYITDGVATLYIGGTRSDSSLQTGAYWQDSDDCIIIESQRDRSAWSGYVIAEYTK